RTPLLARLRGDRPRPRAPRRAAGVVPLLLPHSQPPRRLLALQSRGPGPASRGLPLSHPWLARAGQAAAERLGGRFRPGVSAARAAAGGPLPPAAGPPRP